MNYPNLPPSYEGIVLVTKWVDVLGMKKATDKLSEEEYR